MRLGVEIASFARAAASFTALTGVSLSKSALHRLAEEYGTAVVAAQAAEARTMVEVPRRQEANGDVVWRTLAVAPAFAALAGAAFCVTWL